MPSPADRLARLTRKPERALGTREEMNRLLDGQLVGTLATVVDGQPWVVPMLYGRDGDRILLHGSTGAGALRQVASGAPAAFCVTAVDGLVVAESTFESSANYRSVVIRGSLESVTGQTKSDVLQRITAGSSPAVTTRCDRRPPNRSRRRSAWPWPSHPTTGS